MLHAQHTLHAASPFRAAHVLRKIQESAQRAALYAACTWQGRAVGWLASTKPCVHAHTAVNWHAQAHVGVLHAPGRAQAMGWLASTQPCRYT